MEIIALVIALVAVYAVKAVAVLRHHDDEIAKSVSFSWTKPVADHTAAVSEAAVEQRVSREHTAWTPSYVATRIHAA